MEQRSKPLCTTPKTVRPKFILAGIGTKGDLFPLVALAEELRGRGHRCAVLANRGFDDYVTSRGLEFVPVAPPQENNHMSGRANLMDHVFPSFAPTFEYFRKEHQANDDWVVVNLDYCSATNLMCELYRLPLCRLHLAPWLLQSLLQPAWPYNKRTEDKLGEAYRRFTLPGVYEKFYEAPFLVHHLNKYRRELGLEQMRDMHTVEDLVTRRLGMFSEHFAPPPADWPSNLELVGFPLPPSNRELCPRLQAFLNREGRPLVFTPGTGVVDVDEFFDAALLCCQRLDLPGVFLSPHYRPQASQLGMRILHLPFVELEPLLARSALLVHHGGIGTTARALQAGIPQVIRAQCYDQPDNGQRIERLGLGKGFQPSDEVTAEALTAAVGSLLADPAVLCRAAAFGEKLRGSQAIARAVDALERAFTVRGASSAA
jgi:UDP:flavonoid glycosyltransferase YjiC (YdhE family)